MTTQNDPTLSAITLDELPSLDEIRSQIDPRNWNVLKPVMQHLPLLGVLNEIMNLVPGTEEKEKRALFDLARLAIAKHEYTRRLYSDIIVAVTSDTDLAGNLTKEDAGVVPARLGSIRCRLAKRRYMAIVSAAMPPMIAHSDPFEENPLALPSASK